MAVQIHYSTLPNETQFLHPGPQLNNIFTLAHLMPGVALMIACPVDSLQGRILALRNHY